MYLLGTVEQVITSDVFNRDLHAENCSRAISLSLRELQKEVKDAMVFGPHTGRLYSQEAGNGFRRFVQASAPGEAPAPRTFALVNSTEVEQLDQFRGEVRVTKFYGFILEKYRKRKVLAAVSNRYATKFKDNVAEATKVRRIVGNRD